MGSIEFNKLTEDSAFKDTESFVESAEINFNQQATDNYTAESNSKNNEAGRNESIVNNGNNNNVAKTEDISNVSNRAGHNSSNIADKMNVTELSVQSSSKKEESTEQKRSIAIIKTQKPLCADYRSDSSSDSIDPESDSSLSETDKSSSETEDNSSDNCETFKNVRKQKKRDTNTELSLDDLPPIENLRISVPESECVEIGVVTSIVDTLVVVESYKGTAALDVDTVLFLDNGKRPLGKIFEILGPISEPIYTIRFNNQDEINTNKIEKGLKVYFAPKTKHTSFVFLSEVMKNKGSDASWKDNVEAPPEFQDFSDDEEEIRCKNKNSRVTDAGSSDGQYNFQGSRKRAFNFNGHATKKESPSTAFKNPSIWSQKKFSNFGSRFDSSHRGNPVAAENISHSSSALTSSQNIPSFPGSAYVNTSPRGFPSRFTGPPFSSSISLHVNSNQNFYQPFYQQRMSFFPENYGVPWHGPICRAPPPPPPLPSTPHFPHLATMDEQTRNLSEFKEQEKINKTGDDSSRHTM